MYWNSRRIPVRRTLPFDDSLVEVARSSMEVAADKVRRLADNHPDYFPVYSSEGKWRHEKEAWTNWCEGFLGGQMWIFAELGLGDDWRTRAEHYSGLV